MVGQGRGGALIQIGSIYGAYGPDNRIYEGAEYKGIAINNPAVYSVGKAGVLGSHAMARHRLRGTWNSFQCGAGRRGKRTERGFRASLLGPRTPLGRMARKEEIVGGRWSPCVAGIQLRHRAIHLRRRRIERVVAVAAEKIATARGWSHSRTTILPVLPTGARAWIGLLNMPGYRQSERRCRGRSLALAGSMADPFERQVAVVGAGLLGNGFMSLLEAAWVSERAEALALEVRGGPARKWRCCTCGQSDFPVQEYRGPFAVKPVPQAGLRAIARTASWTSPWRLPSALLSPEAVAISHNALLIETARQRRVAYHHAANILAAARSATRLRSRNRYWIFRPRVGLPADTWSRPSGAVPRAPAPGVRGAAPEHVRADCRGYRRVATRGCSSAVWSGTNGAYATRAIASEVLRRGGTVDVFDHGGATGISAGRFDRADRA